MSCNTQEYLAAYVLDALEPDETAAVRSHLPTCAACRNEVTELSQVPTLLSLVRAEDLDVTAAEPAEPPPAGMLDRLLAATRAERDRDVLPPRHTARRWPRRAAGLAAVAALAGTIGGLTVPSGRSPTPMTTIRAVDPATHVRATVVLIGRSWGTQLGLTLSRAYPGKTCWLVARADDGRMETAATWVASQRGAADVPGATAIPPDHLTELDVVAANGHALVRITVPHHPAAADATQQSRQGKIR